MVVMAVVVVMVAVVVVMAVVVVPADHNRVRVATPASVTPATALLAAADDLGQLGRGECGQSL
jgi:hypothetical protein